MATLGAITQLPKDFFLHAATLAGAASANSLSPDRVQIDAASLADAPSDAVPETDRHEHCAVDTIVPAMQSLWYRAVNRRHKWESQVLHA